jgi:DNA polymerase-3 subunit epsilon
MPPRRGIADHPVADTPIAVFDFETTGLNPGYDRVVEVSVIRLDPGQPPRLVFDTLINPRRRVSATEIHGITDADVADAPEFDEITGDLLAAISGCVLTAYNVYFDMRFLAAELDRVGVRSDCPYFCLMYLRPMLGLGSRCSLEDACRAHGITYSSLHVAAADALAGATLLQDVYFDALRLQRVETFGHLAQLKSYKFVNSFELPPLSPCDGFECGGRSKSRYTPQSQREIKDFDPAEVDRHALGEYWEALKTVVYDLQIDDEELAYMLSKRHSTQLADEQLRMLHARAFSTAITQFIDDEWLDQKESRKLARLHQCLSQLGWAPGE